MRNRKNNIILEIGIIIVVLGFLAWITWGQFDLAKAKSRDVERKSELHEVSKVVGLYYKDYGKLPEDSLINSLWGKEWRDGDYVYMKEVPRENYLNDKEYCYKVGDDGRSFYLLAELENKGDVDCLSEEYWCNNHQYCYRDLLSIDELLK